MMRLLQEVRIGKPENHTHLSAKLKELISIFIHQIQNHLPEETLRDLVPHWTWSGHHDNIMGLTSSLHMFSSGAESINGARDLLAPHLKENGKKSAATYENGSEVLAEIDIKINLRDIDNERLTDDLLLKKWQDAIHGGARFISFTLASKSGRRYDDLGRQIAAMVRTHNELHPKDTITLVVDAVQMIGRDDHKYVFDWLSVDGVDGVVHTGSKAPGGLAHAGYLWLNKSGMKKLRTNHMSDETNRAIWEKRGWMNYTVQRQKEALASKNKFDHLASLARGIDNTTAICTISHALALPRFKETMQEVRKKYAEVFESVGFEMVDKNTQDDRQLPSLLTFTHPSFYYRNSPKYTGQRDVADKRRQIFDTYLYNHGAAPGGYLHDTETLPMFRWGLDWGVGWGLLTNELSPADFDRGLAHLKTVLTEALAASKDTVHMVPETVAPEFRTQLKTIDAELMKIVESVPPESRGDITTLAEMSQRLTAKLYTMLADIKGADNILVAGMVSGERSDTIAHIKSVLPHVPIQGVFIDLLNYYSDADRAVARYVRDILKIPLERFFGSPVKSQYEQDENWWNPLLESYDADLAEAVRDRIKGQPYRDAKAFLKKKAGEKQLIYVMGDMKSTPGREDTPLLEINADGELIFYPKAFYWNKKLSNEYSDAVGLPRNPKHNDPTKTGKNKACPVKELTGGQAV
jgi:hypothetical protein